MPLDSNNHEKWGFSTPKIWAITPKNEGYGFPWCLLSPSLFEAANIELRAAQDGGAAWLLHVPAAVDDDETVGALRGQAM